LYQGTTSVGPIRRFIFLSEPALAGGTMLLFPLFRSLFRGEKNLLCEKFGVSF
jgi:hypothetical protein